MGEEAGPTTSQDPSALRGAPPPQLHLPHLSGDPDTTPSCSARTRCKRQNCHGTGALAGNGAGRPTQNRAEDMERNKAKQHDHPLQWPGWLGVCCLGFNHGIPRLALPRELRDLPPAKAPVLKTTAAVMPKSVGSSTGL